MKVGSLLKNAPAFVFFGESRTTYFFRDLLTFIILLLSFLNSLFGHSLRLNIVKYYRPLIKDDEIDEFDQFLNAMPEEGQDTDPNVDEFIQNDRFIRDFDDDDSNA